MIEQFTDEELATIKKELGVKEKHKTHKRFMFAEEYQRVEQLTTDCELIKAQSDVWYGMCAMCDHAFENYIRTGKPFEIVQRYSVVWDDRRDQYKNMLNELIDVFEKYQKEWKGSSK